MAWRGARIHVCVDFLASSPHGLMLGSPGECSARSSCTSQLRNPSVLKNLYMRHKYLHTPTTSQSFLDFLFTNLQIFFFDVPDQAANLWDVARDLGRYVPQDVSFQTKGAIRCTACGASRRRDVLSCLTSKLPLSGLEWRGHFSPLRAGLEYRSNPAHFLPPLMVQRELTRGLLVWGEG